MQLINSQYRIIDLIKEDKYYTKYLVEDIHKDVLLKTLNLIEKNPETDAFIEYMKVNFYDYVNLAHPNLAKFYYFNRVRIVDTKPVLLNKFYYTYESIEGEDLFHYVRGKSIEELLDLSVQVLAAIKYLHLRGYVLCSIDENDIFVIKKGDKQQIKITAFPYAIYSDSAIVINKDNSYFKAPESVRFGQYDKESDIYLIGIILYHIFTGEEIGKSGFRSNGLNMILSPEASRISPIIEKCIASDSSMRYASVEEIAEDLNNAFNKSYNIIDKKYIETLPHFSTKLVARESFIKRLIKNVNDYFYGDKLKKLSVIIGDSGIGKGVMINTLITRLTLEGEYNTFISLSKESQEPYFGIKEIIKDIIKYADKDIVNKYIDQLSSFIPELAEAKKIATPMAREEADESYKVAYRLGNFILETSLKWPFVIILKNYDYIDEESKRIINYIFKSMDKGKLSFVFSFNEEISEEEIIGRFKSQLDSSDIDIIKLTGFNIYETAEAIRIMLGMDTAPIDFATSVFKETEGNPSLVYEATYAFFQDKHIYVDDSGKWVLNKADFSKIKLSVDIDDIARNRVNKLEDNDKKILEIISVFNTAMSGDILVDMSGIGLNELSYILENLVGLNILSRRMDDWGITYDFISIGLKKWVYDGIPEDTVYSYHDKASKILEEKFELEKRENKDELIYQMSKSGRIDEAADYLIKSAKDMTKKNLFNQGIQFLKQGYLLYHEEKICPKKTEISTELGDLYYKIGKLHKALKYYEIAKNSLLIQKDSSMLVDIYIKMIYVNYKLSNIKRCLEYSSLAKTEIKAINYEKGRLELVLALSDLIIYRRKAGYLVRIIEKILDGLDEEKDKYYYGVFLSVYGKALRNKFKYKEAIKALNKSIQVLEELEESEWLLSSINSLGVVYIEYMFDTVKAKEYFERTLSISQRINNIPHILRSLNNIADMYREEDSISESLVYFNKALDLAEYYPDVYTQAILYLNCAMISLETEDYKKYKKYIAKGELLIFENKNSGKAIDYYYNIQSVYYYIVGEYEKAMEYTQKSKKTVESWGGSFDGNAALVDALCKAKLYGNLDFKELRNFCLLLYSKRDYKVSRIACHKIAELFIEQKKYNEAKTFLEMSSKFKEFKNSPYLELTHKFLTAMITKGDKKVNLLTDLIKEGDKLYINELRWKIYKAIGMEQLNSSDFHGALKNFLSSFNYLRILTDGVSTEYKIRFLQNHSRDTIKDELLSLAEKLTGKSICIKNPLSSQDEIKDIDVAIDEYFDYRVFKNLLTVDEYGLSNYEISKTIKEKDVQDFLGRISRFGSNTEDNIKGLVDLMAIFAQSKNSFLAVMDEDDYMRMLYSNAKSENGDFYKYIIEKVRQTGESIIIPDAFEYKKKADETLIPKYISSLFCIPVMPTEAIDDVGINRRKVGDVSNIKGYLYFDTDSIINNFSEETGDLFVSLSKLAYILIDNYNLKMVNAIDKLTKLYTRKYFENSLLNELANAVVKGGEFSLIMADIDRFKTVNDRYGHQVGDEILAKIAELLMSNARKTDICARYGGEEFIMLLPHTDTEGAYNLAEKIRKKIESTNLYTHCPSITISMGVSTYPVHSTWMKDLIDKADQALYYSKENGRNQTTIYDANLIRVARRADKLAGIISGNMSEDINNVENLIEVLELQRDSTILPEDKAYRFLGRMIEVFDAQRGLFFFVDDNNQLSKQIARNLSSSDVLKDKSYNSDLLENCIKDKSGEYLIDWSSKVSIDTVTGMPDWQSIMVAPIINHDKVNAVIYLTASLKDKEFDANAFNYISTLCNIIAPVFTI